MTDIIDRIKSLRYVHVPQASQLFEEAIAEIERLRLAIRRLAEQDATLSVQGGNVTVTVDATLTASEPIAFVAFAAADGSESRYVTASREEAQEIADDYGWIVAPLFAGLTDAERLSQSAPLSGSGQSPEYDT
jgi:hypothetical protein